jgi:hypothetical protein
VIDRARMASTGRSRVSGHRRASAVGLSILLCGLAVTAAATADHKLVYFDFGEDGTQGGQLHRVWQVAVNESGAGGADPGDVYAADTENHRIQQFDRKGEFVRAWGVDVALPSGGTTLEVCEVAAECKGGSSSVRVGGGLSTPLGVAVDQSDGSVYVFETRRVQKFDAEGGFLWASGGDVVSGGGTGPETCTVAADCQEGAFQGPLGGELGGSFNVNGRGEVAVDPTDGSVYVTDFNSRRVQQLSSAGAFLRAFGNGVVEGGATGTGDVVAGSAQITGVFTATGLFRSANATFRQTITGPGIPAGTTITSVANNGVINLSQPATASGDDVALSVLTGAGNEPQDEVQTVTIGAAVSEGNFKLSFTTPAPNNTTAAANTTANIPFNASPAEVDERLEALGNIGAGQVTVISPNPGGAGSPGGPYTIEFDGPRHADTDVNQLSRVNGEPNLNVTGNAGAAVATAVPGGEAFEICTASVECKGGIFGSGIGQFGNGSPNSISADSSGAVYTVESNSNFRVQKFTPQVGPPVLAPEVFAPSIASGGTGATAPTHVAIGAGDDVYVAKSFPFGAGTPAAAVGERRVLQIDPPGATLLHTHLAGAGVASTNGTDPTPRGGLALDPARGRFYVSSHVNAFDSRIDVIADPPDEAPVVLTGSTGPGLASHLRTLEGTVDPGGFRLTECRFVYGMTIAYSESSPCLPMPCAVGGELCDGEEPIAVSAATEPLEPNTTYHYRLLAANAGEASQGKDRTFTTGPAGADGCPNAAIRAAHGTEVLLLPDCMALEQVSPARKGNQFAREPSAISPDGGRILYNSIATIGECHNYNTLSGNNYVASRGGSGWGTDCTTQPAGIEVSSQFAFASDFSRWISLSGVDSVYRGSLDGTYTALSQALDSNVGPSGASADHSRGYFTSGVNGGFLAGDPELSGLGGDPNLYAAQRDAEGNPSLRLMARDLGGEVWGGNCGARLGGAGNRNQGAVSADGGLVYFSTRPLATGGGICEAEIEFEPCCGIKFLEPGPDKLRIMERKETPAGPQISELIANECTREPADPCSSFDADDLYQGASVDQDLVYFTTGRQLADSDLDVPGSIFQGCGTFNPSGCDLYLYDRTQPEGERLTQVSAGELVPGAEPADPPVHEVGKVARVRTSITAISADGSRAYFVARGVLSADANPRGDVAQDGEENLYAYQHPSGELEFVATIDSGDKGNLYEGRANWENDAYAVPIAGTGDGHILLFRTKAALIDDGDEADLDEARDLYRYDAKAETLVRVSVAAAGADDDGPFDAVSSFVVKGGAPLGPDYGERRRWASEDGETVVFRTGEPLVPGDLNAVEDAYMWREGKTYRLPGSLRANTRLASNTPTVSHDGSVIAYHSVRQLLPSDGDTVQDVYALRVNGGYPLAQEAQICEGEACQGAPQTASVEVGAASAGFVGRGNLREGRSCARPARQAQRLSKRAKRGRRNARRLARNGKRGHAKDLHRRATRLAGKARRTSKRAKRCRSARAANTNRRVGK